MIRKPNFKLNWKYALGELVLIFLGISLAIAFQNWNEQRKQEAKFHELVAVLKVDFTETRAFIETSQSEGQEMVNQMERFFDILNHQNDYEVDTLRKLMLNFFKGLPFQPQLASLKEAENTGMLHLIESRKFFTQLTAFNRSYGFFESQAENAAYSYANGAIWELRKTFGFLNNVSDISNSYGGNKSQQYSFKDYQALYAKPLTQAALESSYVFVNNGVKNLERMKSAVDEIIKELDNIK